MIGCINCATSTGCGGVVCAAAPPGKGAGAPGCCGNGCCGKGCCGKGCCGNGCWPGGGIHGFGACPGCCASAPPSSGFADMLMTAFNCASSCALRCSNSFSSIF